MNKDQAAPVTWEAFREVLGDLDLPIKDEEEWNALSAGCGPGDVFTLDNLSRGITEIDCSSGAKDALAGALETIRQSRFLRQFFYCFHRWVVAGINDFTIASSWDWKPLPQSVDPTRGLGYAVALLLGTEPLKTEYARRGVGPEVLRETLNDLPLWIEDYMEKEGVYGLNEVAWPIRHFQAKLFSLGRLQFEMTTFKTPMTVYNRKADNAVVAFVNTGQKIRRDGQFHDADHRIDPDCLTTSLTVTDDFITGHLIAEQGAAWEPVSVAAADHELLLQPGDPVLYFHIPATGPLDPDACRDSFQRVHPFFSSLEPPVPYKAFMSDSWIFDPQLQKWTNPASNVVKFQKEFFLHPIPEADSDQIFERVFRGDPHNHESSSDETSLQKAIRRAIIAGVTFRNGGALYFHRDVANWGQGTYSSRQGKDTA
jgi:hypothetical protein